jgi:hypothetical protein
VIEEWAPADSLLGLLQRGRGLGYQRARDATDAAGHVVRCIAEDPRLDAQIDERAWYYARLVRELDIPVAAIPADPSDPCFHLGLAFDVLLELCGSGSVEAAQVVREHLAVTVGQPWTRLVERVWNEGGPDAREGLAEVVLPQLDDDELAAAVRPDPDGPWRAWSDRPRVRTALRRRAARLRRSRRPRSTDPSDQGTEDLRRLAEEPMPYPQRSAVFQELARRGDTTLLDLAERDDLRSTAGAMGGLGPRIRSLGPVALPRARSWTVSTDPWLRHLGRAVVCDHGDGDDATMILDWLTEEVRAEMWFGHETLVAGLARLRHLPALPLIERTWRQTPHSWARTTYLRALIALDAPGLDTYLADAADDCESRARELAAAHRAVRPPS